MYTSPVVDTWLAGLDRKLLLKVMVCVRSTVQLYVDTTVVPGKANSACSRVTADTVVTAAATLLTSGQSC
jgi:hypothetical protein